MDEKFMRRAIELARLGDGFVNPNPLVGAVIVKDGRIIGEGYHERYGALHAERSAIAHLTESAAGADIYVTLEPCCHYGKQPPCTEAVVKAGIKNVYVGSYDPNPLVAGKGFAYLRAHGVNVVENVLREECDALNDIFFHYIIHKRPYVIMKAAVSLDGRIAARTGDSQWITNEQSRANVHRTRKTVAAIMVGINTVLADDPMLNCRTENPSHPIRIVCDSRLRIPMDCQLVRTAKEIPVIAAAAAGNEEKARQLRAEGVEIIRTQGGQVDLTELMSELGRRGIDSVLLEGGASMHASMLKAGLVDKLQLYVAPKIIGGDGKPAVGALGLDYVRDAFEFQNPKITQFGDDLLLEYTKKG